MNSYLLNLINQHSPNFGWIPDAERTLEQKKLNFDLISAMPQFKIEGNGLWKATQRSSIYECVKKLNNNKLLKPFYQEIGSCVGHGAAKVLWYLMHVEKVMNGDREQVALPYEPYQYATSRYVAGISGNSDGSFGTAAADAAKKYGILDSRIDGLPAYKEVEDCITFSGSVDKDWGRSKPPDKYMQEGIKHLVKTTAILKTTDDVIAALSNGYPVTCASMWGGLMECPIKGTTHPVRVNRHSGQWAHQQCVTDFFDHSELGMLYHIDNSWGPDAHGRPPIEQDSPLGGYWISPSDMKLMLSENEVIAYSNFNGFPEQRIDQALLMMI